MAIVADSPSLVSDVDAFQRAETAWRPLLSPRTWVAILVWLIATDLAIYRGGGWSGFALVVALVPAVIAIGPRRSSKHTIGWAIACALIAMLSAKMLWCAAPECVLASIFVVFAAAMAGHGAVPYVAQLFLVPFRMMIGVMQAVVESALVPLGTSMRTSSGLRRLGMVGQTSAGIGIPVGAVILFAGIFILANPNFRVWTDQQWRLMIANISTWLQQFDVFEVVFWAFSGSVCLAMLFPYVADLLKSIVPVEVVDDSAASLRASYFYPAARNTMSALIVLFAVYLTYEFYSMWFRDFPEGFYYAGYAHEGAFWLTVALALAVFTLSMVFSQTMRRDNRTNRLMTLAWLWSAENFLLAAAVYNRLMIYIDFNGMTRMRIIGLLGVTAVVMGFCLVIFKIARQRNFEWLINRQLWALALALVSYAILPVDWLVHRYNAGQVLAGDLAPSVQMIVHPTRADGMLEILHLIDSSDTEIREGVRALAAKWSIELSQSSQPQPSLRSELNGSSQKDRSTNPSQRNWTHYQLAEDLLSRRLAAHTAMFAEYLDTATREERLKQFYDYAYRWY